MTKKINWREARATWTDDEFLAAAWSEHARHTFGLVGALRATWECGDIFDARGQKWMAFRARAGVIAAWAMVPILIICLPVILHSGGDLLKYHAQRRGVNVDRWLE